jgi:hypothetical protein
MMFDIFDGFGGGNLPAGPGGPGTDPIPLLAVAAKRRRLLKRRRK